MKKRSDFYSLQNRRGQVTIFIILAIVIVVGIAGYFVLRGSLGASEIPSSFEPVETTFLNCMEGNLETGISLIESSGGYIEKPSFIPGSDYMPFSSWLNFFGVEVPYWFYITGNNLAVEQIPDMDFIEEQLENFVVERADSCNFNDYLSAGYSVSLDEMVAKVSVDEKTVSLELRGDLAISDGSESFVISNHDVEVNSLLGSLYSDAVDIYDYEQEELVLENYTVDVLRNYAPVDGVEFSCSPINWDVEEVYSDFIDGLENNILSLKNKGRDDDYFALNLPVESDVRFFTSSIWPHTFEVNPSQGNLLVAEPIGNQQGLGVLGFCYVTYHFVYNFRYPILVQVSEGGETFQFPLAVLVEGNLPKKAAASEIDVTELPDLCLNGNTPVSVSVYDRNSNPVEALVSYECFSSECDYGVAQGGYLEDYFPQCVNGKLTVTKEGYRDESVLETILNTTEIFVVMEKEYDKEIVLDFGEEIDHALISFVSDFSSESVVYPEENEVTLSGGHYNVSVQIYSDSEINLPEAAKEECIEVPRNGVFGLAGLTKKECTAVIVPEQILTTALVGGGSADYYVLEEELVAGSKIKISGDNFNIPKDLDELESNYILIENAELEVEMI